MKNKVSFIAAIFIAAVLLAGCTKSELAVTEKATEASVSVTQKEETQTEKQSTESISESIISQETETEIISESSEVSSAYTEDQLIELAFDYYEMKSDYRPSACDVSYEGDMITIHLFDNVDDHTATCDWYTVDIYTAKGTDFMENEIDLKDALEADE